MWAGSPGGLRSLAWESRVSSATAPPGMHCTSCGFESSQAHQRRQTAQSPGIGAAQGSGCVVIKRRDQPSETAARACSPGSSARTAAPGNFNRHTNSRLQHALRAATSASKPRGTLCSCQVDWSKAPRVFLCPVSWGWDLIQSPWPCRESGDRGGDMILWSHAWHPFTAVNNMNSYSRLDGRATTEKTVLACACVSPARLKNTACLGCSSESALRSGRVRGSAGLLSPADPRRGRAGTRWGLPRW